jgi:hypothetical protein
MNWDWSLVTEDHVSADCIHYIAERLEPFTNRGLRNRSDEPMTRPAVGPHNATIPPERNPDDAH